MSTLSLPHQIISEVGGLQKIGEAIQANGGSRPLIVLDSFLARPPLNINEKIASVLKEEGIQFTFFSDYAGEPTSGHVESAINILNKFNADCVIAVGGGSAIDISKAVSLFSLNPNLDWDMITSYSCLSKLPLLAVPTTAGTGSEATRVMVITNNDTKFKMNPGHHNLIPDVAILDPELTISLPKNFTAFTGLDALTHAIEAYVSNCASVMTDHYALKAIQMIGNSIPKVIEDGSNVRERENMLLASCYAGIAFSNSSTNLAHAAARPLGARFHIPHGLSVALFLPSVMQFGLDSGVERYADIAKALGVNEGSNERETAQKAIEVVENFNEQFEIWDSAMKYISDIRDIKADIPVLVEDAMSGNGIKTNRKEPSYNDIKEIYESLINKLNENYSSV